MRIAETVLNEQNFQSTVPCTCYKILYDLLLRIVIFWCCDFLSSAWNNTATTNISITIYLLLGCYLSPSGNVQALLFTGVKDNFSFLEYKLTSLANRDIERV